MSSFRNPSHQLTFDEAVDVWLEWWSGTYKNRIAAKYDVNVWRLYEVRNGEVHPGSREVAEKIWVERGNKPIRKESLGPLFDSAFIAGSPEC